MVQVGDWIRLHEDSVQEAGERIPPEMLLLVTAVGGKTISIKPPFEGATHVYWHDEYDVVEVLGKDVFSDNLTMENCAFPPQGTMVGGLITEGHPSQHLEPDMVTPPYLIGDPPIGTTPGWITTTSTNVKIRPTEPDMVQEPPHYKIKGDLEVIDVIEALAKDDAWYANAIKYLLRAKKKGKLTEDLGKCKFYIDRMLRDAESEAK
jgi:hypothetical protein